MKITLARGAAWAAVGLLAVAPNAVAQSPEEFFETRVRPVLAGKCYDCHARVRRGGLRVNSLEALLAGGRSGPAIVPGDPESSLLIKVVQHEIEDLEMPQDAPPLTEQEILGLVEWIRMDAPWPEEEATAVVATVADNGLSPGARMFVDRVRPVLERSCFACHTDEERGGLRLDSRERVLQGGGRGPAVVPGNPEGSLIIAALRHEREDLRMPRNADRLTAHEIEGFVEWIRAGAEWADVAAPVAIPRRAITAEERSFWSFQPLTHAKPPAPRTEAWARTDIDRFVLAKLEEQGLTPVGPASKRQLIRRATFDLIGLPPTPEEVEAFVADESPDAFEKVVDRLLASEHYGERWGRHWLDVIRFGEDDTHGLAAGGSGRERYPMGHLQRDWVVKAFNEDMPYDKFVMAHLAGDLMPEDERDELLPALGYLGQGPWYYDNTEEVIARADERHDRVDVTTRAFLGLTVGCARCHDHKYDPIGTHDYYSLAGIFNNTNYYEYPLTDSATAAELKEDQDFIQGLRDGLREYLNTESEQLARVLTLQASRYMMAAWQVTGKEQIPVETAASRGRLDLETLERWIDFLDDEAKHYPFLIPWQEMIEDGEHTEEQAQELADDFQRLLLEIVAEQQKLEERNRKIIAKGTPLEEVKSTPMPNGFESFFDQHQLELDKMERERFNLYTDVFVRDLDNELDTFFRKPALLRFSGWGLERQLSRVASDHLVATREEIERLEEELPDIPFVMGVTDKDEEDIEDIALHLRGNPKNLGEPVPRTFLHVLDGGTPETYADGSGRLELARDIAEHPITARVIVNRVWAWHMGSGIVTSPSNFGFAGDPPTNPELLEYLARRFVDGGMSIKALHRDIMLSSVYQLAADDNAENREIDGANRYFWRFNRQRLDAEAIRDALLHVAGNLDTKIGGESFEWEGEGSNRRTLYGEVSRFQLNQYLQTFDFPNPSLSAERRYSTNVPLQSLYFMNSPFVQRQAEALVRRLAKDSTVDADAKAESGENGVEDESGDEADGEETKADDIPERFDDEAMIEVAYPLLYGRSVTEEETELGLEFLTQQRASWLERELQELEKDENGPGGEDVGSAGEVRALAERRASMHAWVQYARALLAAAEFRFID
jgi:mono/diheme cytochrome c family protein